ncbi:hypothetical protein BHE74_00013527, partial [Ensete ventricosum]
RRRFHEKDLILKMGACVSVQGDPDSAARWRLGMASKAKRFFVPSPAKEKAVNGENPVARFDLESQDFGMMYAAEESVDIDAKLDEYITKTDRPVNSSSATPFQSGASSICSSELVRDRLGAELKLGRMGETSGSDSESRLLEWWSSGHSYLISLLPLLLTIPSYLSTTVVVLARGRGRAGGRWPAEEDAAAASSAHGIASRTVLRKKNLTPRQSAGVRHVEHAARPAAAAQLRRGEDVKLLSDDIKNHPR